MERERRDPRKDDPSKREKQALLASIAQLRAAKTNRTIASLTPLPVSDDSGSDNDRDGFHLGLRNSAAATSSRGANSFLDDALSSLASLSIQGSGKTNASSILRDRHSNAYSTPTNKAFDSSKDKEKFRTPPEHFSKEYVSLSSDEDNDFQPMSSRSRDKAPLVNNASKDVFKRHEMQRIHSVDSSKQLDSTKEADLVLSDGKKTYCLSGIVAHKLYKHQVEGIKWLWSLHIKKTGGILGDDMGLGKTRQIASFLAGLFSSKLIKTAMIVAPKTLISHWTRELSEVGLSRKTFNFAETSSRARDSALHGLLQRGGVLLTTYDMVRCNWRVLRGETLEGDEYGGNGDEPLLWDYLILDEGHLIKNPSTERAKSLREISSSHRVILSGTPIQNHLKEMWALFDFCCPNLLGDKAEFKAKYESRIVAANDKSSSDRSKRLGAAAAQELRQRIAPFFLRRLKSEVFPEEGSDDAPKLSHKNDLIVWLQLTNRQEKLYRAFLESEAVLNALDGSKALTALSVMKKICDHPSLLTQRAADDIAEGMEGMMGNTDPADAEAMTAALAGLVENDVGFRQIQGAVSCKIAFLILLLEKLVEEGHRTLIFSQTRKMLNIIQEEIENRKWRYRRIDGTMKSCDREQCVQDFQTDPYIPLFLLTSQVGGLGLTLTSADRVVIVDPAWNPSTDNQSVDRAYRIGQKKNVIVYRLMTCGTLEEKIYRKQVFKGGLMKTATETKNQMRYFSQQELHDLFRVPETGFQVSVTQRQMAEEHAGEHRTDKDLEEHIRYLEGLSMIAGVSHHDLLYSKAAPELPPAQDDEDDAKAQWEPRATAYPTRKPYKPSIESYVWEQTEELSTSSSSASRGSTENQVSEEAKHAWLRASYLKDKIKRMAAVLENEEMSSKLSDGGMKIIRRIKELNDEVAKLEVKAAPFKENLAARRSDGSSRSDGPTVQEKTLSQSQGLHEPVVRVRSASGNNIYNAARSGTEHHNKPHYLNKSSDPRVIDLESKLGNLRV
ncbi:DNA excision repair protein ERCC-6-like [Marchantia polymorpha subsp. ruderalis]|uniref:Protein CHROMATIN REMODELING 24 n=2 Tax=Marchantia polymorpha TaxID=3197 RepID=A0AAF6AVP4_MARPO|nr:hypothetical protein MARPO_0209s0008 [Marchantia polymorpha]PTQ27282.1 hypothetical protein MARPO_0209s0008 [Marchantia polymorpha]BBN00514.1 hypothetical protein Mp_1g29760 [Marchantia polymorpha subsp. ruderalis]BBN00515.1 hypothetical protein Mp_1g29760 [Marchantia polymorpha subsp. ruderalis]|eukprot:PTQ27280.1 hypothetical protein MARPO_0209s0008 [Marchantia polymorpha]